MRVAIILLCILALYACQKNSSRIKPVIEDISESVYASGVVKSKNQYEVFSTVNGIINDARLKNNYMNLTFFRAVDSMPPE